MGTRTKHIELDAELFHGTTETPSRLSKDLDRHGPADSIPSLQGSFAAGQRTAPATVSNPAGSNPLSDPNSFTGSCSFSGASSERLRLSDPGLAESLGQLARLMANVTDAYTAAIFLADSVLPGGRSVSAEHETLELVAYHTLSREVIPHARISFGNGLVGWTAENGVRISVCPFEHDASTLLFYSADQALKSFIALPILDQEGALVGVLSCDSKKSYAFAKITEKVLLDCAQQISHLVSLHSKLKRERRERPAGLDVDDGSPLAAQNELGRFLDRLRGLQTEEQVLSEAANLSQDLVERDALVIVTSPVSSPAAVFSPSQKGGMSPLGEGVFPRRNLGAGLFPSPTNQPRVSNRLLELVCRHKGVLCVDRNVQALTTDEKLQRSFLSIPFRVLNREAGSVNILSRAFASISSTEIAILERVAEVLGHEIELRRLRERNVSIQESTGLLPWKDFAVQARFRLSENLQNRRASALLRLRLSHLALLEDRLGTDASQDVYQQLLRLIDQVKGSGSLGCYLAGTDCLILLEGADADRAAERLMARLRMLIERVEFASKLVSGKFAEEVKRGILSACVIAPRDGETLDQLINKSLRALEAVASREEKGKRPGEEFANAVCW